jgi:mRNA interferase MazF
MTSPRTPAIQRAEIWYARLPRPTASGPGYPRPVLVIQADSFNRTKLATVLCAVITSNLTRASAPGNVFVSAWDSGLSRDSVVNVTQLVAVDRSLFARRMGSLEPALMDAVASGLRLALGL